MCMSKFECQCVHRVLDQLSAESLAIKVDFETGRGCYLCLMLQPNYPIVSEFYGLVFFHWFPALRFYEDLFTRVRYQLFVATELAAGRYTAPGLSWPGSTILSADGCWSWTHHRTKESFTVVVIWFYFS
ncbi:hypothetical protein AMECASPLE_011847 [Ameca splendens]|uniref:Uncharacterized protein n=1 Tax=Ameca splendens TaxID=208324 RepID=A0ABV0ZLU7_9TELE